MKTADIRRTFLQYFEDKGHAIVSSSSLVPGNDPTLLFTNAGMVQFKDVFLGQEHRDYNRATTSQRCVRAGGKHNDLDNVGYTARHHTFFEMLGNFSFGDYFKEDAIKLAWEFLTVTVGLPADRLWVTVFEEDDEAAGIWLDTIGVPAERLARIGAEANFWSMGDTGPCGPCSEIFFDHGPEVAGGPPGTPEEDGDRYVEIWNLVFMQFNRDASGTLTPLPKPSVDTGMGLERVAAVLQGVHSNYEIDLFANLIEATAQTLNINDTSDSSLRVIADHIRSTAFLIADGVTPSNEGRGYVLRRIIRRAIRHGYQSSGEALFMHKLVRPLVAEMGDAFPELQAREEQVTRVLKQEGERFAVTLDQGLKILDDEIRTMKGKVIAGDTVFKLYDTFGFPADLTADVARERGLEIDQAGFETAMQHQRATARAASQFKAVDTVSISGAAASQFLGYEQTEATATIKALTRGPEQVTTLAAGDAGMLILDATPFYAESGGQVGDKGQIKTATGVFDVTDTQTLPGKLIAHQGQVSEGTIDAEQQVEATVIADMRADTARNHSATHLLHAALRNVLGDHVEQKGSLVTADKLRFDFSHNQSVTAAEVVDIERLVNAQISSNHAVQTRLMALDAAREAGAAALFGEKYDDEVRVVSMGAFSMELCGGTHVARTGDIGFLRIVTEGGVAAGVRRIEALSGARALEWSQQQTHILQSLSATLKSSVEDLTQRATHIGERNRQLEKQLADAKAKLMAGGGAGGTDHQMQEVGGIKALVMRQDDVDPKALRPLIDQLRTKIGSGIVVVGGVRDNKASVYAGVTKDISKTYPAGELIAHLATQLGGRGGGKPEMGQGGGPDVARLDDSLASVNTWISSKQ